jgi:hypothetical protein
MDMKKILQTLDTASAKTVEGSNDMKKFLSVVTEGASPHKVTLPVQMAMQHYSEPKIESPKTIKEVKKSAMSGLLHQYYTEAQTVVDEEAVAKKELISEQARLIANRLLEKDLGKHNNATTGFKALAKKTNSKIAGAQFQKMKKAGQLEESDKESFNAEYDDEAGMADNNLSTLERAVDGIDDLINTGDNLPEWCQEKIAIAKSMLVTVWDYMKSEETSEQEVSEGSRNYDDNRTGFSRGHDHRGLEQELAHETNNYAVSINGKSWKVFGSRQEANRVSNAMERKYPDKKIGVHATGAPVSEGVIK